MPHLPVSVALKAAVKTVLAAAPITIEAQSWGEAAMKVGSAAPTRTPLNP